MTPCDVQRGRAGRWLISVLAAATLMLLQMLPARAAIDCLPPGQPLLNIPEIVSHNGVLRGTILLSDEQQRLAFRSPTGGGNISGKPGLYPVCNPQYVRIFHGVDAQPPLPPTPPGQYADPVPGPTLRARVGDIIELTFLNQINPVDFGNSIDQAENGGSTGCDSSTAGYPSAGGDAYPDCFHGSSTGNIHFHGSHTNVNGTGDNVFLGVRPSPRDSNGNPTVTAESVKTAFDAFFAACERELNANVLSEWPTTWNDPPLGPWSKDQKTPDPNTWTGQQALLLQAYDKGKPPAQQLWPVDQQQIAKNEWPQYYIGAFPYCFRIPKYIFSSWPPPPGALIMGQSPGTHWYHAHKHGSTAIDVANGMTGVFIIEGQYDEDLNTWYGDGWTQRQPVLVLNQLGVSPNLLRSGPGRTDKGPDFSVNGRAQPVLQMRPGEVQLWRLANTSGRSGAFFLGPPPGFKWRQLAQDGVQFADQNYKASENETFLMAPGNRVDLLVQAPPQGPATAAVYPVVVQPEVDPSDLAAVYPVTLFSVQIRADAPPVTGNQAQFIPSAPKPPPFLTDITNQEVQATMNNPRVVAFTSTGPGKTQYGQHEINGEKFNEETIGEKVQLNAAEEWKITNGATDPDNPPPPISHPFHIHLNPFQVVEIFDPHETLKDANGQVVKDANGNPVPKYVVSTGTAILQKGQCQVNPDDPATWKACTPYNVPEPRVWWDVFPIPSGVVTKNTSGKAVSIPGYFKMRSRFVDYPGWYVLHCHILAHEDRGMMTVVELTPAPGATADHPPFLHH